MSIKRKSQLKKLKVDELKEIIRKYTLGNVNGKKEELIERIGNHQRFKEIKKNIIIPERIRKSPSESQIKNRQNFQKMVFEKHKKIHLKKEDIKIKKLPTLNESPFIQIREIIRRPRTRPPAYYRPRTP